MNLLTSLTIRFSGVVLTLSYRVVIAAAFFLITPGNLAVADTQWVERPDPMREYHLADWDRSDDRVRILYVSRPDLEQSASENWNSSVYIAELFPDGCIENRQLVTGQRYFSSLVLQRSGESVFAVPNTEVNGAASPALLL